MSLTTLTVNCEGEIRGFSPELSDNIKQRLRELGFQEGERVKCLRQIPFGGPKVYLVGDAVFSLAADVSSHVLITRAT